MEKFGYAIEVIEVMKRVMHNLKKSIHNQFKNSNLTGPQGMLIGTLMHCEKMKISQLSEKLFLSNSTVSGIIDRLEKQEIVERIRSNEDRRVVYVKLTEQFRKDSKEKFVKMEKSIGNKISKATDEERATILKGLKTLEEVLNRENKQ